MLLSSPLSDLDAAPVDPLDLFEDDDEDYELDDFPLEDDLGKI